MGWTSVSQAWPVEATSGGEQAIERKIEAPAEHSRVQTAKKIHPKSVPNRPKINPKTVLEAPREPSGVPRTPQSAQECPQKRQKWRPERHRRRPWTPQGRPRSDQVASKSAQGGSKRLQKGVWEAQNRARGTREAKKSQFRQKCSATRPCRCARHFEPT